MVKDESDSVNYTRIFSYNPDLLFIIQRKEINNYDMGSEVIIKFDRKYQSEEKMIKMFEDTNWQFKVDMTLMLYLIDAGRSKIFKLFLWWPESIPFITNRLIERDRHIMLYHYLQEHGVYNKLRCVNLCIKQNNIKCGNVCLMAPSDEGRAKAKDVKNLDKVFRLSVLAKGFKVESIAVKVIQEWWRSILENPKHPVGERFLLSQFAKYEE